MCYRLIYFFRCYSTFCLSLCGVSCQRVTHTFQDTWGSALPSTSVVSCVLPRQGPIWLGDQDKVLPTGIGLWEDTWGSSLLPDCWVAQPGLARTIRASRHPAPTTNCIAPSAPHANEAPQTIAHFNQFPPQWKIKIS